MATKRKIPVWRHTLFFAVAGLVAACGESDESAAPASAGSAKLDACKLLADANAPAVIGEESDSGTLLWAQHTDAISASQCTFTATQSGRSVGLMIRRERGSSAPASRAAFIASTRESDSMGVGAEMADALDAGKEIPGLGNLALTYDLISFNLMVWKGDLQLTVLLDGFGTGQAAEEAAIRVAKVVLGQT